MLPYFNRTTEQNVTVAKAYLPIKKMYATAGRISNQVDYLRVAIMVPVIQAGMDIFVHPNLFE